MTHSELVEIAGRWLRGTAGCKVVMTELVALCGNGEIPDAIGWRGNDSILVECKTSRADFFADRAKTFRREPERGMGALRYFLAPEGVLKVDDLPPRWGLLESRPRGVRLLAGPNPKTWSGAWGEFHHTERAHQSEMAMLLSGMNRLRLSLGDAEFRRLIHLPFAERQAEIDARVAANDSTSLRSAA
ncbi:hypothetical protein [Luteibacter yeojuensis]|uniref:Uncharacterized protein n=1 Tax=Luteibacter yeojuensis TaxID=345309 RepID=A0A7X5TPD3_9GAMM|nr:hypothetical protein [Luteibacter yeojuensis]NID14357.1 hypothetical protein [Luteibacter yeojuensis]